VITLGEILPYSSHRFPSRTALIESSGASITYQDLEQQVQQLAGFLGNAGIGAGDCIGIVVPKSIASVTAILACLQIGSTYIPADPQAPSTRNALIFGDACPQAILVHTDLKDNLQEAFAPVHNMVAIPDSSLVLLFCEYTGQVPMDFPDDLAYLLYTSGSTGRPKGVMISHGNALSFVDWSLDTFPLTEQDVFSSIAPLHFDLSIFDLFVGLKAGAAIVLFDQKAAKNPMLLSAMIETHQISVLYATPTLLRIILQYGKLDRYDHHSLRVVHFAGEVFPVDPLRKLQSIWKTASFFNLYGPTETNVVTWHPIPRPIAPGRKAPYPIGKSCSHVVCKLFQDGFLTETPGVEGELVVSGASVAHTAI
jgi:non-ribosomal peptide synthetase component F